MYQPGDYVLVDCMAFPDAPAIFTGCQICALVLDIHYHSPRRTTYLVATLARQFPHTWLEANRIQGRMPDIAEGINA